MIIVVELVMYHTLTATNLVKLPLADEAISILWRYRDHQSQGGMQSLDWTQIYTVYPENITSH